MKSEPLKSPEQIAVETGSDVRAVNAAIAVLDEQAAVTRAYSLYDGNQVERIKHELTSIASNDGLARYWK